MGVKLEGHELSPRSLLSVNQPQKCERSPDLYIMNLLSRLLPHSINAREDRDDVTSAGPWNRCLASEALPWLGPPHFAKSEDSLHAIGLFGAEENQSQLMLISDSSEASQ